MKTTMMMKYMGVGLIAASLSGTAASTEAQISDFLGPHVVETLPFEIPGTGRIGGITEDGYGYLYVANQDEGVWKIHADGRVERFVDGLYGSASGVALRNGDLIHTSYGDNRIIRVERDGTVHEVVSEGLEGPVGIVFANGALYTVNAKSDWVAKVSLDGGVTEFVRDDRLEQPNGITSDRDGNLYVVNLDNTIILKITPEAEITEVATLPGTANAHVAFLNGALYVTQIWANVVLRVEMDGSYEVVAGDGTLRSHDGPPEHSQVPFPNGIIASRRGDGLYFNTLEGDMVAGHPGIIRVHKLHVPNPNLAFANALESGGMSALRAKFDAGLSLDEVSPQDMANGLYGVARYFLGRGEIEAGLALIDWTAAVDEDELRRSWQRGRAHFTHGDGGIALRDLERAAELAPDNETLQQMLAAVRAYRRN